MPVPNHFTRSVTAAALLLSAATLTFTPGCTTGRDAVPRDADRLASGEGSMTARATHDGTAYVLDETDNKVVWTGPVRRDDEIVIDPADNRIRVGGDTVKEKALAREHRYIIYLRR